MAIYRGTGGSGDSTTDATITEVTQQAVNAQNSADAAAASATAAATSATNASASEASVDADRVAAELAASNAATSESNAATSASSASTSATNSASSAAASLASQTAAATSESNAATSESNAATSESNASSSATSASNAQAYAEEWANNNKDVLVSVAAGGDGVSDYSAKHHRLESLSHANDADDSRGYAAQWANKDENFAVNTAAGGDGLTTFSAKHHAAKASASATAASTSESNASTSATNAATSETNAATSATNAATSATNAATSETNASTSESNAATSASNASTSETNASTSESNAATSATAAATSETNAGISATTATTKASEAATSATDAAAAKAATESLFDQFGDQYLGTHAADPTLDNDGDPLNEGDVYWNSTDKTLRFYTGTAWVAPETVASTAATNAANSATAAATSATNAASSESSVATNASNAATSATNAATSETNAASSATNAATSETNAASSATSASTSATSASTSASTATTKASEASTSASNAATSATNAANSATAAATSESNASTSETNASNSATAAATSATNASASAATASTSETNAATSASAAATSATNAATSESNASTSASNASTSETNAAASLTTINGVFLGVQTSDPTTDLNGVAVNGGEWYYNSATSVTRIHDGTQWQNGAVSTSGFVVHGEDITGAIRFTAKISQSASRGQAVYVTGVSGNFPTIALADNTNSAKMPAFGLLANDVTYVGTEIEVDVVTLGTLSGLDTSSWSVSDTLFINGSGNLTNTKPSGESNSLQNIGMVQRVHASNGSIKVGGAGRTAATPNLDNGNVFIGNAQNYSEARALTISDVTNLQSSLDGKVDDSQVLTNVPLGAVFTDTVYTHPTGDGNLHVPATGTTNNGKLLTAGSTAGSISWQDAPIALPDQTGHSGKVLKTNGTAAAWETEYSYTLPASVVHDTEKGALHATDALRISGHTISLYKGDGTSESVTVPDNNTTYSEATSSTLGLVKIGYTENGKNYPVELSNGQMFVNVPWVDTDTDTNTWRGIHDTPVDGATTTSISSNWAFDNVKTAVPTNAVFTDTVYTHPIHAGDDFSVDTGALTGATVVSDIDINVTTDTLGHVTDANGTVSTRTLTLADLGYTEPTLFPSGTSMLFAQTAAPTGWTKSTTHNNKALRVVSGTAGSGGTTAFTTAFGTPAVSGSVSINGDPSAGNLSVSMSGNVSVSNHTLSINQIPSHTHSMKTSNNSWNNYPFSPSLARLYQNNSYNTGAAGGNGAHSHGATHNLVGSMSGAPAKGNLAGSLSSATAGINVQYVDVIIATKN